MLSGNDKKKITDQLGPTKWDGHWQLPAAQLPPLQETPFTLPQIAAAGTMSNSTADKVIDKQCDLRKGQGIAGDARHSFAIAIQPSFDPNRYCATT